MPKKKDIPASPFVPEGEQPYPVPENWCWVKFSNIIELISGRDAALADCNSEGLGIPYILGASNIENNAFTIERWIEAPQVVSKKGDILLSVKGTIGKLYVQQEENVNISRQIMAVRPARVLKNKLAYLFLQFVCDELRAAGNGLIPGISRADILDKAFPFMPLPEQHRIVNRIEGLFAKLDAAKEKAQAVVDGFELRKSAILHKAFTGELTERWRKEHGVGLDSWEKRNIQSVCAMKITDGTHKTPIYCEEDEGIPFISAKDVTSGKICWDNIRYIIPELHEELYQRLAPQVDDILLAKNGTTGVAAIVEEEKIFDLYVTLAVLRPNKETIVPEYLLYIVNSPICKLQFDEHLTGIGVPNLHLRDIKEVLLNVPSLEEQREIVRIIDKIIVNHQQAQEAAEAVLAQTDTMKKAILARAFRGELGTNDPAEEWAGALLEAGKKICF